MQTNAMGKEAETKTESQIDLAIGQDDTVALAAFPCRQSSAGFALLDSELGGRRGSSVFGIIWYHFAPEGKKLMDRPKPVSHLHLRRAVDPALGGWRRGPRRGDSGPESGPRAEGGGRESGRRAEGGGRRTGIRTESGGRNRIRI